MNNLDNIGIECGTDKSSVIHNYLVKYEKYLPFNQNDKIKILEIGVLNGESLCVWKKYYPNAEIIGIDIDESCKRFESENIKIEIGSQYDEKFLKQIIKKYGEFDLILDDGSHMNNHVIFSFKELFSSVKSGGVYVVEDCCTSYWSHYGGERYGVNTIIEYFKGVVDEVNFFGEIQENYNNVHARREDLLIEQFKRKGYDYIGTQIESINFMNGIILITKR
jgi:cephalosporin hydroxylase